MAATFPTQYAAARKALRTAETHVKPLPAQLDRMLREHNPVAYEEAMVKVAEIAAGIPALRAAFDALDERACGRCNGTGEYGGPTHATRRGVPYCFKCNGTGENK